MTSGLIHSDAISNATKVPIYENSRRHVVYDHRFKRWMVMWSASSNAVSESGSNSRSVRKQTKFMKIQCHRDQASACNSIEYRFGENECLVKCHTRATIYLSKFQMWQEASVLRQTVAH